MAEPFDVTIKTVKGVPLQATIFPASSTSQWGQKGAPIALYYHSGGLTGGSRLGYFPYWLSKYCNERGIHLATLDYRLIPTGTLKDVEDDVLDGYRFCANELSEQLRSKGYSAVDPHNVIVTSASAGCLAAALLVLRILDEEKDLPPPKLFLGLYGMTNIASSFYNVPKTQKLSVGKDTSQRRIKDVQHLFDPKRLPCMGTDVKWFRTTIESATNDEERVAYDQTNLTNSMFNDGVTADIMTSTPGLSEMLRQFYPALDEDIELQQAKIPAAAARSFPIPRLTSNFPKTLLFHGEEDAAIKYQDSEVFVKHLQKLGVPSRFVLVKGEGSGHGFERQNYEKFWRQYMAEHMIWLFNDVLNL